MTVLLIAAIVVAVPVYVMIGSLAWLALDSADIDEMVAWLGAAFWPTLPLVLVCVSIIEILVLWPIRLALRLPGWLARRRQGPDEESGTELPRARTVQR